jgi:CheY-like chemotaxis protein/anti-sigma regulatory factor (Ser/Thr protein kinase)
LILIGDPGRLKQILFNLISNAIKFSDKGEVQVQVELVELKEQAAQLKFIVKDNGIGLSAKAKKRLFQPLTQADGSHTRRFGGTGLGLAISKKLVNLMQGEIGVESEEGEGSIFWFTVPFKIPVGHEPLRITPKPPLKLKPGKLILMVEDETVMRELTTLQLEKLGYRIIGAANGRAGVEAFQKEKFDLIIMDCQMPVMSGFAATRIIRELESQNNSHIPIIALTANAFESDLEKCLEAGMDAYLIKPTSLEKLATALYDLLT